MTGTCALCGAVGPAHAHHLTGRAGRGLRYFDPALTTVMCRHCHSGAGGLHPLLRTVGLDIPPPGIPLLAHRLRRVAVTAELVADAGRPFTVAPVSARGLAALLREGANAIGGSR